MATDREPTTEKNAPAPATLPEATDPRRRAALGKLGRTAAYAVPATISLMMMSRSARAS